MFAKSCALLSLLLLAPHAIYAQAPQPETRPPSSMGSIDIEEIEGAQGPYAETQDKAIIHFQGLAALGEKLSQGTAQPVPALDENTLKFLNEIYLLLTLKKGSAPLILDALLESDVINSRLKKASECPNLKEFWRLWLHDDMEKKQSYMINTGLMNVATQFSRTERPKYIKCEETVRAEMAGPESDQDYFKARYAAGSTHREVLNRAAKLLDEVKKQVPNVFVANGGTASGADSERSSKSKEGTQGSPPAMRKPSSSK